LRQRGPSLSTCLRLVGSSDGATLNEDDLIAAMTEDVQIALFPAVLYVSGQLLDTARLTREAHRRGLLIGFDCSHSIGAIPHRFDLEEPDFAFWCNYKYLCGGPGATGGLYLNRRHFGKIPGLAGWFGSKKTAQFAMSLEMTPADHAGALQIGTPNILSMAPLQGVLELFAEAGIENIRAKSLRLTEFLIRLVERELEEFGVTIGTPRETRQRGGHVAMRHPDASRLCRALRAAGVIPDFRPPDTIRLAPVPLYTTFSDCAVAIARLATILRDRRYEAIDIEPSLVP
jgi:kynureninase